MQFSLQAKFDDAAQNVLKDPNALKKLISEESEYVKKYGKEAYDTMVKLAAEKSAVLKKSN